LAWHIGTAISIPATVFVLYLNVSEYSIDPRVGLNDAETSNIIAGLQLLAKLHELMIITSLVNITRQWIQRSLLDRKGTPLGLVGAELSIMNARYLISDGYWAAVKAVFGSFSRTKDPARKLQRRNQGTMLFLLAFLPVACLLCLLVGPASATLMIPRQYWFFMEMLDIMSYSPPVLNSNYPNIFIDSRLSPLENHGGTESMGYENYWRALWQNTTYSADFFNEHDKLTHLAPSLGVVAINSTTSWRRPLSVDAEWKGKSNFRSIMINNLLIYYSAWFQFRGQKPKVLQKYTQFPTQATTEMTGLEMDIVCRLRAKKSCVNASSADDKEWCYVPVFEEPIMGGPLRSNRDLLLISDHRPFNFQLESNYGNPPDYILPKMYITEGPRIEGNERFTNSIVFVFEEYVGSNLFVCSTTNAILKGATVIISDLTAMQSHIKAEYHEYISHFKFDNVTTTLEPPRPLIYYEHWLDTLHMYDYDRERAALVDLKNQSADGLETPDYSTPRFSRGETINSKLKNWGAAVVQSATLYGGPIWMSDNNWTRHLTQTGAPEFAPLPESPVLPPRSYIEAGIVEIALGGSWFNMLLDTAPSASQYQSIYSHVYIPPAIKEAYPEPILNYSSSFYRPLALHHFVYGYRLSSRTSVIAAFLLSLHAVIALAGSIWQLRQRCVIISWGSIPEYVTLCVGSLPLTEGIKNTCAGIQKAETLQRRVRIGETVNQHLEIAVMGSGGELNMIDVEKKRKYGDLD
jgi:hypothetical protein